MLSLINFFFGMLLRLKRPSTTSLDVSQIERVCFISLGGLGNFVQRLPVHKKLRETLPNAHITIYYREKSRHGDILELYPEYYDKIAPIPDTGTFWEKWRFCRENRGKFDLVFTGVHGDPALIRLFLWMSGARWRIGHTSSAEWSNSNDALINVPVPLREDTWEPETAWDLLRPLGVEPQKPEMVKLRIPDDAAERTLQILSDLGIGDKPYVTIQHGSWPTMDWKRWPLEYYAELSRMLAGEGIATIFLGSQSEGDELKGVDLPQDLAFNLCGHCTIMETASLIKRSRCLVCHDSGLMHVGVMTGAPVLAVYGPTDHVRTFPRWGRCKIIRTGIYCSPCFHYTFNEERNPSVCALECTREITPERLLNEVKAILSGSSQTSAD